MSRGVLQVGIDVTGLFWKYRTGVQNYYYGLIEGFTGIERGNPDVNIVLIDRSVHGVHHIVEAKNSKLGFRRATPLRWLPVFDTVSRKSPYNVVPDLWNKVARGLKRGVLSLSKELDRMLEDIDVLQVWNWDIRAAPQKRNVIAMHDVIPVLFSDLFLPSFVNATKASLDFARKDADQVIAVSEFTKRELMRVAGVPENKITVIHEGVRSIFKPMDSPVAIENVLNQYGIKDHPYILSVGYLDTRKNVKAHIKAFELIARERRFLDLLLVLVGPESPSTQQVTKLIESSNVRDRILITGYVPDNDLIALLNRASAFVYCSLYEGFGVPVLEAMACGTPVVTSNTTSLPEISGDATMMVDPEDYDQIAEALRRVLTDDALREDLKARGISRAHQFTWEKCAQEHLVAYKNSYRREQL